MPVVTHDLRLIVQTATESLRNFSINHSFARACENDCRTTAAKIHHDLSLAEKINPFGLFTNTEGNKDYRQQLFLADYFNVQAEKLDQHIQACEKDIDVALNETLGQTDATYQRVRTESRTARKIQSRLGKFSLRLEAAIEMLKAAEHTDTLNDQLPEAPLAAQAHQDRKGAREALATLREKAAAFQPTLEKFLLRDRSGNDKTATIDLLQTLVAENDESPDFNPRLLRRQIRQIQPLVDEKVAKAKLVLQNYKDSARAECLKP